MDKKESDSNPYSKDEVNMNQPLLQQAPNQQYTSQVVYPEYQQNQEFPQNQPYPQQQYNNYYGMPPQQPQYYPNQQAPYPQQQQPQYYPNQQASYPQQGQQQQYYPNQQTSYPQQQNNNGNTQPFSQPEDVDMFVTIAAAIFSFFIPIGGFIIFCIAHKQKPKIAKACLIAALISTFLVVFLSVFFTVCLGF